MGPGYGNAIGRALRQLGIAVFVAGIFVGCVIAYLTWMVNR